MTRALGYMLGAILALQLALCAAWITASPRGIPSLDVTCGYPSARQTATDILGPRPADPPVHQSACPTNSARAFLGLCQPD
jgi:hypothetical protein